MSHFTTCAKANIVDEQAFIDASKELGFTKIQKNATMRGYQGNKMKADVVVSHPACPYDVGIIKNGKRFDLIADFWGVNQTLRDSANAFSRTTTKHTLVRQYRRQGFQARITTNQDNSIHISLTR